MHIIYKANLDCVCVCVGVNKSRCVWHVCRCAIYTAINQFRKLGLMNGREIAVVCGDINQLVVVTVTAALAVNKDYNVVVVVRLCARAYVYVAIINHLVAFDVIVVKHIIICIPKSTHLPPPSAHPRPSLQPLSMPTRVLKHIDISCERVCVYEFVCMCVCIVEVDLLSQLHDQPKHTATHTHT